jgi:hypothetical protein
MQVCKNMLAEPKWTPTWPQLTKGAAAVQLVTEGCAALHAACALCVELVLNRLSWGVFHHLTPICDALVNWPVAQRGAVVLQETTGLQDQSSSLSVLSLSS